jgi:hypothetical protein
MKFLPLIECSVLDSDEQNAQVLKKKSFGLVIAAPAAFFTLLCYANCKKISFFCVVSCFVM